MNILYITPRYPPDKGGGSVYSKIICENLAKAPDINSIIILTEYSKNKKIIVKNSKITLFRIFPPRTKIKSCYYFRKAIYFILFQIIFIVFLPLIVFFKEIDLIHTHTNRFLMISTNKLNLINDILLYLLPTRIVGDARGLNSIIKAKCLDRIICCSKNVLNLAIKEYGLLSKAVYVPIPIDIPSNIKNKMNLKCYLPYICYVGQIAKFKGVYRIIDAYFVLKELNSSYKLLFVGPNDEGENFFKYINKSNNIIYLGPKGHDEALEIMYHSDLVMLPSESEGLPRSCLEAMALKKKVVLPPNIPEFEEHCPEFVLDDLKISTLGKKIKELLLTDAIPQYPTFNHKIKNTIELTLEIYRKLLYESKEKI